MTQQGKGRRQKIPTRAVALRYDVHQDFAPRVTAKGQGSTADRIIGRAQDHEVPVYQDERLVKELLQFELGTEIPPELYEIVAQVLVFVESVDAEKGAAGTNQSHRP